MVESDSTLEIEATRRKVLQGHSDELAAILLLDDRNVSIAHLFVHGEQVIVGRVESADIVIDDSSVSRRHARFMWTDGRIVVEDLGSRNGTWFGGKRIGKSTMQSGDRVSIGKVTLAVVIANPMQPRRDSDTTEIQASEDVVIKNPKMLDLYQQVRQIASHSSSVLILGETGTGKDHVAKMLHLWGDRREKPFVTVNCGAIPKGQAESILFGYEKGAFAGADEKKIGLIEQADRGVLFLDEVAELSNAAQKALLRAIETKTIIRLGSSQEIAVDIRIVAATNRSLQAMAEEGSFRRDLFHRLAAIILELPPLRERRDEIRPLIDLFVKQSSQLWIRPIEDVQPEVIEQLEQFFWPGNIRQLRNVIESSVLKCTGQTIEPKHLPEYVFNTGRTVPLSPPRAEDKHGEIHLKEQVSFWEATLIAEIMKKTAGDRMAASRLLHIPIRTLSYKLKIHGLLDTNWTVPNNH